MATSPTSSGGAFLARKSELLRARQGLPDLKDVLVVDDESFDAERLTATLRVMFGYEIEVRRAATLASALDRVIETLPEVIFLDDILKPADDAAQSIPYLRRAGYTGPIIVISGQATRARRSLPAPERSFTRTTSTVSGSPKRWSASSNRHDEPEALLRTSDTGQPMPDDRCQMIDAGDPRCASRPATRNPEHP